MYQSAIDSASFPVYLYIAAMSRKFLLLFLLAAFVPSAGAQADAWLQVTTPHFVVISNSTEQEARHTALQFERMRSVFARVFPDQNIDTPTPIVVLAVQDKRNLQAIEPSAYLGKGQAFLVGWFLHAPEKNYVLILLNAPGQHPYAPIYHEYAHFVQSRTGEWMPLWLSEGWAEFYQTAEILANEVVLGKFDVGTWQVLESNRLLPLPTLFAVDMHSPYYHEEEKTSMFYAESWALTHYIKMKDARENTHRIQDYLDLVHKNADAVAAATQAFGDLAQLQSDLRRYIANPDFDLLHIPGFTDVDDSHFTVQTLTQTQADTVRADLMAYDQRDAEARTLAGAVLHDDPANVQALETMGYMAFRQLNFDEARQWFEQALKLDPQNLLANYYFAGAVIRKGLPDAATQARVENSLRTAIKLNPSFAPAYYGLGLLFTMQGKNYEEARRWIEKAIEMDPGNVEFRIDYANLLSRMKKNQDAVDALELALKMAHTPEQTVAVENVLQTIRKLEAEQARLQRQGLTVSEGAQGSGKRGAQNNPGVTDARGIYTPQPDYTEEAREARREGVCVLSLIVGVDGRTSNIIVTKKLGMGLDEKAVEAVSRWRFEPGRRNGRLVPTHLTLSVEFKLFGDNDKILRLSEKAKTGDAAAEFELANAFFAGRDIPKDEARGLALLERAARDGLPEAQFQMGERTYGNGSDPETYVSAYVWYVLAQHGGFEHGRAKAEILAAEMTPEQSSEAQKRLDNWTTPPAK
ncbi:MAG: TonB family protein [Terriglobales bacterium]